jgi:hypothetical protein
VPIGFEIEEYDSGECRHFACDSVAERDLWIDKIMSLSSQTQSPVPRSSLRRGKKEETIYQSFGNLEDAVDESLVFDLFADNGSPIPKSHTECEPIAEEATSETRSRNSTADVNGVEEVEEPQREEESRLADVEEAEEEAEEADVNPPPLNRSKSCDALTQLQRLDEDMEEAAAQLSRSLAHAEADCRGLLRFFGLEAPDDAGLGTAAVQLLDALNNFSSQVCVAWADLKYHESLADTATGAASSSWGERGGERRRCTVRRRTTLSKLSRASTKEDAVEAEGKPPLLDQSETWQTGDVVEIDGHTATVKWDGRPHHTFAKVEWANSSNDTDEVVQVEKIKLKEKRSQ